MMKILVTGGLGYIGSHTVVELVKSNHEVVIVDNLVNSKIDVLAKLNEVVGKEIPFYRIDVRNIDKLRHIFIDHKITGVIHFAGLKAVGESVEQPLKYYDNNIMSTISLCKLCKEYDVSKIVFSSSATVYGNQESPLSEQMELQLRENPYGETKAMCERILSDFVESSSNLSVVILRYFNPVGAHKSGLIGEDPNGIPNNLMPYLVKVAKGEFPILSIFGSDYDTVDGTGVRDYIHVVDLARGHVKSLEQDYTGVHIFNLGTGKGTSVLELVRTFIQINGINVPYKFTDRRSGDVAICYADASKAKEMLKWEAEKSIEDMVRDSWNFVK